MLTPEQIADGWIEHDGGPCPVALDKPVWVLFRDREEVFFKEASWGADCWWHTNPHCDDIIAYRPETPA